MSKETRKSRSQSGHSNSTTRKTTTKSPLNSCCRPPSKRQKRSKPHLPRQPSCTTQPQYTPFLTNTTSINRPHLPHQLSSTIVHSFHHSTPTSPLIPSHPIPPRQRFFPKQNPPPLKPKPPCFKDSSPSNSHANSNKNHRAKRRKFQIEREREYAVMTRSMYILL